MYQALPVSAYVARGYVVAAPLPSPPGCHGRYQAPIFLKRMTERPTRQEVLDATNVDGGNNGLGAFVVPPGSVPGFLRAMGVLP
jgi:hypothetical protein